MGSKIKKVHLRLLLFLALSLLLQIIFGLSIDGSIIFIIKVLTYITGLALFIHTIRKWSFLTFYASLYVLSPIGVIIGWLLDRIFGAILGSLFLVMWGPSESFTEPKSIIKSGRYEIRKKFSGFLGGCCSYDLYEKKFLLIDLQLAEFRVEHAPNNISGFKIYKNQAIVYYKNKSMDSTIVQIK